MTAEQLEPDYSLLECHLFDEWVMARRQGLNPDIDALAMRLPEERRAAFKQMLRATAALQILAGVSPVKKFVQVDDGPPIFDIQGIPLDRQKPPESGSMIDTHEKGGEG